VNCQDKKLTFLDEHLRIEGKGAKKRLALGSGFSASYITQLTQRKKLASSEETQRKIAEAAGYSYEGFFRLGRTLKKEAFQPTEQNLIVEVLNGFNKIHLEEHSDRYRGVPLYESGRLSAFSGGYTFDENETPESTVVVYRPELRGRVKHDLKALRVGGDSMEPVMPSGSIVIVDLNDKACVDKKIYVVRDPRDPDPANPVSMVKRVRKIDQKKFKGFALMSENRDHLPIITDLDWVDLVIGRVVWMWRNLEEA
jgi:phage repressor protein C with HTH and peptisase S24 domain